MSWISPLLATAVAYVLMRHGPKLIKERTLRNILTVLFVLAFMSAAVGGLFGAFINKIAPIH